MVRVRVRVRVNTISWQWLSGLEVGQLYHSVLKSELVVTSITNGGQCVRCRNAQLGEQVPQSSWNGSGTAMQLLHLLEQEE